MSNEKLIYASAARRAILKADPSLAYVIDDIKAVDAVEVVHGKWIHASNKPGVWIGMKCSLCGARIRYSEFTNGNHNYCHKCGAKMEGGNEDGL